ncbi:MAG: DNA recombination protein RmuC [Deltaproteobacteria bacterium]|nr:DNA recombination protein RmuC [Deltaproteobacteria bacterium]
MELLSILTLCVAAATLIVVLLRRPPPVSERIDILERNFSDALRGSAAELARAQADAAARIRQEVSENLLKGLDGISRRMDERLSEIRGEVARELSETADRNLKGFDQVAGHLKELSAATGQVVLLSRDINQLNVLLTQPRARGVFGELTLTQMLADLFGDHAEMFELQFLMDGGEKADAAIFVRPDRSQFVCVDSKFPMANAQPLLEGELDENQRKEFEKAFARDVLVQAESIRSKYIRPPKTLDFAFLFVPAESVYYLLLRNRALHEQLLKIQVIPTSPNSFYAYLQALAFAFRGFRIEQKTREIQGLLERVGKDFERFADNFRIFGRHLDNAQAKYMESVRDVERFRARIGSLKSGEGELPEG